MNSAPEPCFYCKHCHENPIPSCLLGLKMGEKSCKYFEDPLSGIVGITPRTTVNVRYCDKCHLYYAVGETCECGA